MGIFPNGWVGRQSGDSIPVTAPVHKQTAARSLAARAEGYGFPGIAVDGNDLLAVHAVTAEAVERALANEGPTLIECRTYRIGFHNTSDNPKEYREDAEVIAARELDPIERVRRFATRSGWWSVEQEAEAMADIHREIEGAQRAVDSLPRPGVQTIFDHVYERLPARLEQQRSEALEPNALI